MVLDCATGRGREWCCGCMECVCEWGEDGGEGGEEKDMMMLI